MNTINKLKILTLAILIGASLDAFACGSEPDCLVTFDFWGDSPVAGPGAVDLTLTATSNNGPPTTFKVNIYGTTVNSDGDFVDATAVNSNYGGIGVTSGNETGSSLSKNLTDLVDNYHGDREGVLLEFLNQNGEPCEVEAVALEMATWSGFDEDGQLFAYTGQLDAAALLSTGGLGTADLDEIVGPNDEGTPGWLNYDREHDGDWDLDTVIPQTTVKSTTWLWVAGHSAGFGNDKFTIAKLIADCTHCGPGTDPGDPVPAPGTLLLLVAGFFGLRYRLQRSIAA